MNSEAVGCGIWAILGLCFFLKICSFFDEKNQKRDFLKENVRTKIRENFKSLKDFENECLQKALYGKKIFNLING